MELKYYLRGLGLGIVVTAVIMGLALSGQKTMTDEEVIARAKTLGMVENTDSMLLSDTAEETSTEPEDVEQTSEEPAEQKQQESTVEEQTDETKTAQETEHVQEEDSVDIETEDVQETEPVQEEDSVHVDSVDTETEDVQETDSVTGQPAEEGNITITIVSGDSSYSVAKKLADAGIVLTAQSYDAYLCANGYDKKLRTGTFTIPKTASDEQIAKIVTGMGNP